MRDGGRPARDRFAVMNDLAPESRRIFLALDELGFLDSDAETIEEMRAEEERLHGLMGESPRSVKVEDLEIEGPAGPLKIRLYHPPSGPPARAMLWIHGGGWALGALDASDGECRRLCVSTGALVASVDYRLAPEHPFPAGLEDSYSALTWLADHVRALGYPGAKQLVGGDSAGGNLAAAVCILAQERGGPRIDHQLLVYPITNYSFDTDSYRDFSDGYLLSRVEMEFLWDLYSAGEDAVARDPLASVARFSEPSRLPPATVLVATCDVLCAEGEAYARRLSENGVSVDLLRCKGQLHGFWAFSGVVDLSRFDAEIASSLERSLESRTSKGNLGAPLVITNLGEDSPGGRVPSRETSAQS